MATTTSCAGLPLAVSSTWQVIGGILSGCEMCNALQDEQTTKLKPFAVNSPFILTLLIKGSYLADEIKKREYVLQHTILNSLQSYITSRVAMISRAGEREKVVDGAPGVENVVRRINGVEYYSIETFHTSPFFDRITPVFIHDVVNSVPLYDIYGYRAVAAVRDNIIMLKNHPLRRIKIVGRITEYFLRELKDTLHYFLSIDDSSGSSITVKLNTGTLFAGGLNKDCNGYLVEIVGVVRLFNEKLEIHADTISVLNNNEDYILDEMKFWEEAIHTRESLKQPWYQISQRSDGLKTHFKTDRSTHKRRQFQRNINLSPSTEQDPPYAIDSSIHITGERQKTHHYEFSEGIQETAQNMLPLSSPSREEPIDAEPWISISNEHLLSFKRSSLQDKLTMLLFKWIVKYKKAEFDLDLPYKDPSISSFLELIAREKFPLQTVDLSLPGFKIKSVNDIKGETFNDARHELQECKLIECSVDKRCFCTITLEFTSYLFKSFERYKFNEEVVFPQTLVGNFNKKFSAKVHTSIFLLNRIIFWVLKSRKDLHWRYNKDDNAWRYFK